MMADAYCQDGYCELAKEEKSSDRAFVIGVYAVFVALTSVLYWYAISNGIVIDPTYFS